MVVRVFFVGDGRIANELAFVGGGMGASCPCFCQVGFRYTA